MYSETNTTLMKVIFSVVSCDYIHKLSSYDATNYVCKLKYHIPTYSQGRLYEPLGHQKSVHIKQTS